MNSKVENMRLWTSVCETNPYNTKQVSYGKRSFTAIDAYSQILRATEEWGPYGGRWVLNKISYQFIEGADLALVGGMFIYPGGSFPLSSSIKYKQDDEFAKKVETDLITKALSRLGFNADVFLGKYDDNRYVQSMKEKASTPRVNKELVQKYVQGFVDAIEAEDALAMREMGDELKDTPEHDAVWKALDTKQRAVIKEKLFELSKS